jgi:CRP-like cAMP-binding protein
MISEYKDFQPSELLNSNSLIFQEIQQNAGIINLNEGSTFLFPNKVQPSLYFVKHGVLRSYTVHNEQEITRWFYCKNDLAMSFQSFLYGLPSDIYMQSLTPSLLIEVSKDYYNYLCQEHPAFKYFVDRINGEYLVKNQVYVDRLKTFSALERYECFIEEHPEINRRVQVQHIATFLGITPDTLTKVRKKYGRKPDL